MIKNKITMTVQWQPTCCYKEDFLKTINGVFAPGNVFEIGIETPVFHDEYYLSVNPETCDRSTGNHMVYSHMIRPIKGSKNKFIVVVNTFCTDAPKSLTQPVYCAPAPGTEQFPNEPFLMHFKVVSTKINC